MKLITEKENDNDEENIPNYIRLPLLYYGPCNNQYHGIPLTILVVILFSKIDKCKPITLFRKVIEWFGRYSLEIYLIHVSVRRVFNSYKLYPCKIEYLISYIAISLLLVPIVHWLSLQIEKPINKLFKKTTEKKTV